MPNKTRIISRDIYLKSLGLFTCMAEHYHKAQEFQKELGRVLRLDEWAGQFGDQALQDHPDFAQAMRDHDLRVAKKKRGR